MNSKELKKIILDRIYSTLKPRNFVRSGQVFKYSNSDLTYYVCFQSSRYSSASSLIFTINIGIGSELLYKLQGKAITSHLRGHEYKRIGSYLLSENGDKWWTVTDEDAAKLAAEEVACIIEKKVIPAFNHLKSTDDLIDFWLADIKRGVISYKVNQYLLLLEKSKSK
jgi:hypothetical protein